MSTKHGNLLPALLFDDPLPAVQVWSVKRGSLMATFGSDAHHSSSPMLRPGVPGEKRPLKEKLISYYERIFEVQKFFM